MAQVIWKYALPLLFRPIDLLLPLGGKILDVQDQKGTIYLWVLHDAGSEMTVRRFEIFGTGQKIEPAQDLRRDFLATVQQGPFVWHVFELREWKREREKPE
jgi:hypothetical protein